MLHTFYDGSTLCKIGAKALVSIESWKGNRIIDHAHVATITAAVSDIRSLDSGYKLIEIEEEDAGGTKRIESYIIDGQHRAQVLKNHFKNVLCEADFPVLVHTKRVSSETEAIVYFNAINNTKTIHFSEPNLIANKYIGELETVFNTTKVAFIRKGNTHRPYLSVDKLRESLLRNAEKLKESDTEIKAFVTRVVKYNEAGIRECELKLTTCKSTDENRLQKSVDLKFSLAEDPKLRWIQLLI